MLKEAVDMLDDLKEDFYDEDHFSISDTVNGGNVAVSSSNINSPERPANRNSFVPTFEDENCFAGNLTLGLMRSSSFEFPLERIHNDEVKCTENNDMADFFLTSLREPNFPEFEALRPDDQVSNQSAERNTGKFSPNEENKICESDLSFEKTETRRTTRYSDLRKQKTQKISTIKISKKRNVKRKPKKNLKNNIRDSKRECKNIVKNYGKAMATFSVSHLAADYLEKIVDEYEVNVEEFTAYMTSKKETIDSIGSFRDLLCPDFESDSPQEMRFKAVFRDIAEIFVRDFAVNWIFNSKSQYKTALLNYRFKMLRRVRNPEGFTFLKGQ